MPATAYLDFNIFASIDDGSLSTAQIFNTIGQQDLIFPYSPAHIQETDNITAATDTEKKQFIFNRLHTIRQLSKNWYLFHDLAMGQVVLKNEEPATVLNTIREVPLAKSAISSFANLLTPEAKAQIRTELGVDSKLLNNYDPKDVVEHLNKKLAVSLANKSFLELIELAIQYHPDGKKFGFPHRVAAIFELLDMLGYWKDKYTSKSNVARFWDSNHAFYASFCDYFVSDDERTRQKTKVVYQLYNISTTIVSSNSM